MMGREYRQKLRELAEKAGVVYLRGSHAIALADELDAKDARIEEESAIVSRVWKALGISTYAEANGLAIDEHVERLRARIAKLSTLITCDMECPNLQHYPDCAVSIRDAIAADDEAAKE